MDGRSTGICTIRIMAMTELGDWVIVKVERENRVGVLRVRTDEPSDMSLYPVNVSISWPYPGDPRGFPQAPEQRAMAHFEDTLAKLTGLPGLSQLVLVTTGFDLREWQFYVADYAVFKQHLNTLLEDSSSLPLQIEYTDDPEWQLWHQIRDRA